MDRSRCAPFRRAHRLRRIAFWTVTFVPYGILSLFALRRARGLCQATSLFGCRDLGRFRCEVRGGHHDTVVFQADQLAQSLYMLPAPAASVPLLRAQVFPRDD